METNMEAEDEECKKEEEWAKIQENTFTRWVNHQLQSADCYLFCKFYLFLNKE